MADLVQQARAALEGVTPGPWRHIPNGAKTSITDEDYDRLFIASGTCAPFYDACFIAASRDLVPDMADEIERLRARIAELEAENARLRAALEPFALEAAQWEERHDDERIVESFPCYHGETRVGDLRRARAALATDTEEPAK